MPFQPILSQVRKYYLRFDYKGTKIILLAEAGWTYENADEDWRLSTKKDTINLTWNKSTGQLRIVFTSRKLPEDFIDALTREYQQRDSGK
jgi:hypothetical protein